MFLQTLIEMDRKDEQSGKMEEIHRQLRAAYYQFTVASHEIVASHELCKFECLSHGAKKSSPDPKNVKPGLIHSTLRILPLPGIKALIDWLYLLFSFQVMNQDNEMGHKLFIAM